MSEVFWGLFSVSLYLGSMEWFDHDHKVYAVCCYVMAAYWLGRAVNWWPCTFPFSFGCPPW